MRRMLRKRKAVGTIDFHTLLEHGDKKAMLDTLIGGNRKGYGGGG